MAQVSPAFAVVCLIALTGICSSCSQQEVDPSDEITSGQQSDVESSRPSKNASIPKSSNSEVAATIIRFRDRTAESGLRGTYRNDEEANHYSILESLGGGVALFDFDLDGDLDVFVPTGGKYGPNGEIRGLPPKLFRNEGNWQFTDVSLEAGLEADWHYSHGAAAADYDNDSYPDILITGYGGLTLLRNQGNGTFKEQTKTAKLDDSLWSSSAAWGDINGDGHLDLYVAHYVDWSFDNHPFCQGPTRDSQEICPPRRFEPLRDILYLNNGDGTFRDGSDDCGLRSDGKGLGVIMADIDVDGDLDLYVANDTVLNFLYRNDGQGNLKDISVTSGTGYSGRGTPDGSMGTDLGDYNLDGLPDIWVANYERESFGLYRNVGDGLFRYASLATGVTAVEGLFVGWGSVFADFDLDGDEDVFTSNGHVLRHPSGVPVRQLPLLFENLKGQRFRNVADDIGAYFAEPHSGRGVAVGDLDNDGDPDLVISHVNEPATVLENITPHADHHWLGVIFASENPARNLIGAVAKIQTSSGVQIRQVKGGCSYASTNDNRLLFGLGATKDVQVLSVRWPDGSEQTIHQPPIDQYVTVTYDPETTK